MPADLSVGLCAWAREIPAIVELLGLGDAFQLYPVAVLGGKSLPYVIYTEEKDDEYVTHNEAATLASSMLKIECFAGDTAAATALADLFRTALTDPPFSGLMGDVFVQRAIYKGGSPAFEWEEQQFVAEVEFKFWYRL